MPDFCCAYGCSNKRTKGSSLSFYWIPFGTSEESLALRQLWIAAIRKEKWTEKQIDNGRICSAHLISGQRSLDKNSPDYVPSVFCFANKITETKRKTKFDWSFFEAPEGNRVFHDDGDEEPNMAIGFESNVDIPNETDACSIPAMSKDVSSQSKVDKEVQTENQASRHVRKLNLYLRISSSDKLINFYTGLPNTAVFQWVLSLIAVKKINKCTKITKEEHLLLILVKLKLGLLNADLAFRFGVEQSNDVEGEFPTKKLQ
eukprot:gene10139-18804_t